MTKGQRKKKEFIQAMFDQYGFTPDRWGHFVVICDKHQRTYRFKMQKTSVRVEYKSAVAPTWVKHHTTFYSKLYISDYSSTLSGCK